ncbi:MAG: DUF4189 domain-containing protein [Parafilimonas terrae]|nr:DUF4189 domain-containing protein [Parafilimonas terrae]
MLRPLTILITCASLAGPAAAADLPGRMHPPPPPVPDRAIWGAIAYSPVTGADGFFWGGATEAEAAGLAQHHCQDRELALASPGAGQCRVTSVFFNGWTHSTPAAPWPHCGAVVAGNGRWSAAVGLDQASAVGGALQQCGGAACAVVRAVCT